MYGKSDIYGAEVFSSPEAHAGALALEELFGSDLGDIMEDETSFEAQESFLDDQSYDDLFLNDEEDDSVGYGALSKHRIGEHSARQWRNARRARAAHRSSRRRGRSRGLSQALTRGASKAMQEMKGFGYLGDSPVYPRLPPGTEPALSPSSYANPYDDALNIYPGRYLSR